MPIIAESAYQEAEDSEQEHHNTNRGKSYHRAQSITKVDIRRFGSMNES